MGITKAQESRNLLQEKLDFIDEIASSPYSRMDVKQWRGIFHTTIDRRKSLKSAELKVLDHHRWRWKKGMINPMFGGMSEIIFFYLWIIFAIHVMELRHRCIT